MYTIKSPEDYEPRLSGVQPIFGCYFGNYIRVYSGFGMDRLHEYAESIGVSEIHVLGVLAGIEDPSLPILENMGYEEHQEEQTSITYLCEEVEKVIKVKVFRPKNEKSRHTEQ